MENETTEKRKVMKVAVREGYGIRADHNWELPNLPLFDIGLHWHPTPDKEVPSDSEDLCTFRKGIYFSIFGLTISIGHFWEIKNIEEYKG